MVMGCLGAMVVSAQVKSFFPVPIWMNKFIDYFYWCHWETFRICSSCGNIIPPCRKCMEWLGTSVLCFCVHARSVSVSLWLTQLGNNVHFLFSFLMFHQRLEDCKTLACCRNYCIHLFIWGKVEGFDACNQNNASSQQSEQRSWGYFDPVNKHGSFCYF